MYNNNGYNNNYNNNGYNNGYNNNNRNYNNNNGGGQKKKRSRCGHKVGKTRAGKDFKVTWGWKVDRKHGIVSFLAKPYKASHLVTSKTSKRDWLTVVVVATVKATGATHIQPALMEVSTGKVVIKAWNMVMNPKAPNGGYCGSFLQSRQGRR